MKFVVAGTIALMLVGVAHAQPTTQPSSQPTASVATLPTLASTPAPTSTSTSTSTSTVPPAADTQEFWQGALLLVVEAVLAVASPILVVLLGGLIRKMKLKVEMEKLKWVVDTATGFGEQKIRLALKDGKPLDYGGIKEQSVSFGSGLLLKKGLAKKWGGMLGDLIEAKLGLSKLEGAEASKPASSVTTPESPAVPEGTDTDEAPAPA